jgi:hypothetical protein
MDSELVEAGVAVAAHPAGQVLDGEPGRGGDRVGFGVDPMDERAPCVDREQ